MWGRHTANQRWFGGAAAALTLALTTACSGGANASWHAPGTGPSAASGSAAAADPFEIKILPAANAANVSPSDPVTVTVQSGTIDSVTVTAGDGKTVAGELAADKRGWRTTQPLAYGATYTVAASATSLNGKREDQTQTFSTPKPRNFVKPTLLANALSPLSECDPTCGVGTIITVRFDEPIPNKAVAEQGLTVTTNPPVALRSYWLGNQQLMLRPERYWEPGTTVKVTMKAYGRDFGGNGLFGEADASASFKIGQSKIAIGDNNTHRMLVYFDGKAEPVRNIPISAGKGGYHSPSIHFWTMSGTYTVIHKQPSTVMSSESYGIKDKKDPNYYKETIYDTVQLSTDGIYGHKRDWAPMDALGGWNSSHGCINIGPDHSKWFYDTFGKGDVVKFLNSPIKLDIGVAAGALWDKPWAELKAPATA